MEEASNDDIAPNDTLARKKERKKTSNYSFAETDGVRRREGHS
jgi:hypothetical protein